MSTHFSTYITIVRNDVVALYSRLIIFVYSVGFIYKSVYMSAV